MVLRCSVVGFFFFKQKTADEMRISDWSSDVCSSDLRAPACWARPRLRKKRPAGRRGPGPGPAPWPAARRRRGGERACGSWLGGFRGGGGLRCRVACIGRRGRGIVDAAAEHVLADHLDDVARRRGACDLFARFPGLQVAAGLPADVTLEI